MSSYLLLRSNKQLGPFSMEQLLQLGLKPYDLVWVEGRSAAWRYAGEVNELKEYAPMVEEQPYDRFYKKQTGEQIKTAPEILSAKILYEKPEEIKYESYTPKKNVSIVMPKQAEQVIEKKSFTITEPSPATTMDQSRLQAEAKLSQFPDEPVATIAQKRVEVETKYSQSLDAIKDMYVKQQRLRKNKTAQKIFIIQSLKKVAVFVAIIGCGVLIGLALKPKSSVKKEIVNTPTQNISSATDIESSKEVTVQTNVNNTDSAEIARINRQLNNNKEGLISKATPDPSNIPVNKKNIDEKNKGNAEKDEFFVTHPSVINAGNSERNKTDRNDVSKNDPDIKSITITEDLSKLVSVKSNNYKLKSFGGFQNLELTVNNDSKFVLDNVLVELQYLKINDQPAKVDHIRFQSIAPGGSLTIRIPDNNRGAKLIYRIIKIEPKEISTTAG